jgi:hypothetical protein
MRLEIVVTGSGSPGARVVGCEIDGRPAAAFLPAGGTGERHIAIALGPRDT